MCGGGGGGDNGAAEAARREREDVTGFTQDVSKRLFKLKKAEKVKSFQEGNSRASTVWGLPEW